MYVKKKKKTDRNWHEGRSRIIIITGGYTVSNEQKFFFFGRCPLLPRRVRAANPQLYFMYRRRLVGTSRNMNSRFFSVFFFSSRRYVFIYVHIFCDFFLCFVFSTTSTRFVFNPTSGRSRPNAVGGYKYTRTRLLLKIGAVQLRVVYYTRVSNIQGVFFHGKESTIVRII